MASVRQKFIVYIISLILLMAIIYSVTYNVKQNHLATQYNEDFLEIKQASDEYIKKVERGLIKEDAEIDVTINYYKSLVDQNTFESSLHTLNQENKYTVLLREKKRLEDLGLTSIESKLDELNRSATNLNIVYLKSQKLEDHINDYLENGVYLDEAKLVFEELEVQNDQLVQELDDFEVDEELAETKKEFKYGLLKRGYFLADEKEAVLSEKRYVETNQTISELETEIEEFKQLAEDTASSTEHDIYLEIIESKEADLKHYIDYSNEYYDKMMDNYDQAYERYLNYQESFNVYPTGTEEQEKGL
ncbi:hypothetical protein [Aquisalibacillus elongatus]|uniref:Uncharacterized protein n=1 Tax=Aquisalibacillus elongatus TaxID=485577 RepID=A0A3N5BZ79_9BACI|nr:hypothetical protein [Aquisalibacillus elongatus]RPF51165.1 hypothetical protein EDC24_2434 [Aquisalibacillus elongatus]